MSFKFKPEERDYAREEEVKQEGLSRKVVTNHPLAGGPLKTQDNKLSATKGSNPLNPLNPLDPLSGFAKKSEDQNGVKDGSALSKLEAAEAAATANDGFVPWKSKKAGILATYTTDEVVAIEASFMNDYNSNQVSLPVDKQQQRLDSLDESEERRQKEELKVKQGEYIQTMERLNAQLGEAWDNEERVKSLKIAIQCAKVLSDTNVIKFYPSKWVLITEILDTFGDLVYRRILNRSNVTDPVTGTVTKLPPDFEPKDVPDIARETCRNWFFKIASIRELLPRLYVEMAIIRCYAFLSKNSFKDIINRLCAMTRGIGDPLVATFARAYIARKGREVAPLHKEFLMTCYEDYLFTHNFMMHNESFLGNIKKQIDSMPTYIGLFTPAIDWLLQCLGFQAPKTTFTKVLTAYGESSIAIVLNNILANFQPEYIAENAMSFAKLVRESEGDTFPKYKLYTTFGTDLVLCAPQKDDVLKLLNEVWKVVTKFTEPKEYMTAAEVWIEYPLKHCTVRETNTLLGDIIRHVKENKAYESLQLQLQSVILKVLVHYHDFSTIFGMTYFLPLLDLFSGETQVEVNKAILEAFCKYQVVTRDPVIINCMFTVCQVVHDSVNSLSFQDEIRQISKLIAQFVTKIDFGNDVEKHLNFYVDCRRSFANLDSVKQHLVMGVNNLTMKTLKLIGGTHTKKTTAFVRACVAFCFITIPSMDDIFSRLNLYLISSQVALLNQCLPQADSLLKAAIALLLEVPNLVEQSDKTMKSTEETFVSYILNLCSTLVVAPGHPEYGAFYLINGLYNAIKDYKWDNGSVGRAQCYLAIVQVYCTQVQRRLPYHMAHLESNDILYGGDVQTSTEVDENLTTLLNGVMEALKEEGVGARNYNSLVLNTFGTVVTHGELNAETAGFVGKLFLLAKEKGASRDELNAAVQTARVKKDRSKLNAALYEKIRSL
eukprot:TRINITY_DN1359_c0_g1_i2.p1 TRINITY_DN1359_c0_g1~~TRINITY_DN1359_c0_g1_i2.p1  ORF type:complete len:942 (+),score=217.40 TRINITY_DN1359_c0_g1_i2:79-2904(+)